MRAPAKSRARRLEHALTRRSVLISVRRFEPVTMLARPQEIEALAEIFGDDAHARFNGWGGKQVHDGDAQLAALVADRLGIELFDSGLVGEGGAAESCWVNNNRNPGLSRDQPAI